VFGRSGVDPHSASTSSHSCSRSRHCNLHPENKSARSPTERASRATRETRREWRESRYCYWQIPYDSLRIFYVITFDANNRTYTHSAMKLLRCTWHIHDMHVRLNEGNPIISTDRWIVGFMVGFHRSRRVSRVSRPVANEQCTVPSTRPVVHRIVVRRISWRRSYSGYV
jgi:hypothetical protein